MDRCIAWLYSKRVKLWKTSLFQYNISFTHVKAIASDLALAIKEIKFTNTQHPNGYNKANSPSSPPALQMLEVQQSAARQILLSTL